MARLALLVAPLCALASASSDSETLSRGHIVVFKELSAKGTSDVLVKDKNFTVTYTVLNLGEGPAFEVKVQDEWPRNNFVLLEGATEGAWDVLRRYGATRFWGYAVYRAQRQIISGSEALLLTWDAYFSLGAFLQRRERVVFMRDGANCDRTDADCPRDRELQVQVSGR